MPVRIPESFRFKRVRENDGGVKWQVIVQNPYGTACFIIPGRPNTYKSLRVRHGRNVYAIHSKDKKETKKIIAEQKPATPPINDKPVEVRASLHFKRPKSHFKTNGLLKPSAPRHILKRPDIDNCLKYILDSLQPEVIVDDKLVVKVTIVKKWCNSKDEEKTQVELSVVE